MYHDLSLTLVSIVIEQNSGQFKSQRNRHHILVILRSFFPRVFRFFLKKLSVANQVQINRIINIVSRSIINASIYLIEQNSRQFKNQCNRHHILVILCSFFSRIFRFFLRKELSVASQIQSNRILACIYRVIIAIIYDSSFLFLQKIIFHESSAKFRLLIELSRIHH